MIRWKVKGHRQWKIWPLEDFIYHLFAAWQLFHRHACGEVVFYDVCDIDVFISDIWPASVDYTVQDMSVTWEICWNGEQFSLRKSVIQLLKKLIASCWSWRSVAVITKSHRWTRNLKFPVLFDWNVNFAIPSIPGSPKKAPQFIFSNDKFCIFFHIFCICTCTNHYQQFDNFDNILWNL